MIRATILALLLSLQGCAVWHNLTPEQKFYVVATAPLGVVIASGKHQQDD